MEPDNQPELEAKKQEMLQQKEDFKVQLADLKASLLQSLSKVKGVTLGPVRFRTLIESLTTTVRLAVQIQQSLEASAADNISGCEVSGNLIKVMENSALKAGYDLLDFCQEKWQDTQDNEKKNPCKLQIATSESLTAGLIMSTLVKLPVAGWAKYGCCGVYDTDAKRVYLNVEVDDVYTHRCAKEMAIGMLNNSTATLAIAVTGNAMPYYNDLNRLGEVFIGIATYAEYKEKETIIYTTKAVNCCLGVDEESQFKDKCKEWLKPHKMQNGKIGYPPRKSTAEISLLIRNYTAYAAMKLATDFLKKYSSILKTPVFITGRRENNLHKYINNLHIYIPQPKYSNILPEIALSMDGNIITNLNDIKENGNLKAINETQERSQYTATLSGEDWVNSLPDKESAQNFQSEQEKIERKLKGNPLFRNVVREVMKRRTNGTMGGMKGGNNKSKKKKGRKTKKKKTKKKITKIP